LNVFKNIIHLNLQVIGGCHHKNLYDLISHFEYTNPVSKLIFSDGSGEWLEIHQKCEAGFTGLEAAIVLIAFVVVAAVFSYAVLGAGFFTSQTAQATVHTGVMVASSSVEPVGNIYGIKDAANNYLDYVNVTIALSAGDSPIDISSMVVSYTDANGGHNGDVKFHAGPDLFDCSVARTGGYRIPSGVVHCTKD
jgi:flagellin-like protein